MENIINFSLLAIAIVTIVLLSGIVWRVEKRLDISYKFFLAASIVLTTNIIHDILTFNGIIEDSWIQYLLRGSFLVFFMLGISEMRILIRILDGERTKNRRKKR